ncbi:MAG TPA: HAD-IA family hydrolase [Actinomycetota bacterium]|nr:HAD-IA family hydrolase [Actinomycetota bacterium]
MIEIVFLDAGGTMLDPHPSFAELFATVCVENGYRVEGTDVAAVQERLAPHLVELVAEAGLDEGPSLSPEASRAFWSFTYRRFLEDLGLVDESLVEKLYERFSEPSSYRLYDDVVPTLTRLTEAGYRLGLISNFDGWLEKMLIEMEIHRSFHVSVISGVEGVEKPDPAIYRLATDRAGVAPEASVHVGDSPAMDIDPARAAGLNAVLIDRVGRYADASGTRITSLKELPSVVANL